MRCTTRHWPIIEIYSYRYGNTAYCSYIFRPGFRYSLTSVLHNLDLVILERSGQSSHKHVPNSHYCCTIHSSPSGVLALLN